MSNIKTIQQVLAGFQENINDLQAIENQRLEELGIIDNSIMVLNSERKYAESEGKKAKRIARKLEKLIG